MQDYQGALSKTVAILNKLNVYWFLEGGTCLGYLREGKIIAHDHDIDIGIYVRPDQIADILCEFPIHKIFKYNNHPSNAAFYLGAFVDIFFFIDYKGFIVETMHNLYNKKIRLYGYERNIITGGIKKVTFEGITANVLNNSEQYCRTLYGINYLIPETNWNAWEDPSNIISEVDLSFDDTVHLLKNEFSENEILIDNYLKIIYFILYRNSRDCFDLTFYNGLSGLALFFLKYATIKEDSVSFNYAQLMLKRIFDNLKYNKFDLSFLYGYSGIAWIIEYSCQSGLIDGNSRIILRKFDQLIDFSLKNKILTNEELIGIAKYKLLCHSKTDFLPKNKALDQKLIFELTDRINHLFNVLDATIEEYALTTLTDIYVLLLKLSVVGIHSEENMRPLTFRLKKLYSNLSDRMSMPADFNDTYCIFKLTHLLTLNPQIKGDDYKRYLDLYFADHLLSISFKNKLLALEIKQKLELIRIIRQANLLDSNSEEIVSLLFKDIMFSIKDDFGGAFNNDILSGFLGLGITILDMQTSLPSTNDIFSGIQHTRQRSLTIMPL